MCPGEQESRCCRERPARRSCHPTASCSLGRLLNRRRSRSGRLAVGQWHVCTTCGVLHRSRHLPAERDVRRVLQRLQQLRLQHGPDSRPQRVVSLRPFGRTDDRVLPRSTGGLDYRPRRAGEPGRRGSRAVVVERTELRPPAGRGRFRQLRPEQRSALVPDLVGRQLTRLASHPTVGGSNRRSPVTYREPSSAR